MEMESIIAVTGALGGLEFLKWVFSLKSSRRKDEAEAADSMENMVSKRMKTYEESILFLQNQLQEKERQFAELSEKYHESMEKGLKMACDLGTLKLKYRSTRCDRKDCESRKPPYPHKKSIDKP